MPLSLPEIYILFDAFAEYVREKDEQDPHRKTAERPAGMLKSQLSDYAKERLRARLEEIDHVPNVGVRVVSTEEQETVIA